jgi:hypothetical protein
MTSRRSAALPSTKRRRAAWTLERFRAECTAKRTRAAWTSNRRGTWLHQPTDYEETIIARKYVEFACWVITMSVHDAHYSTLASRFKDDKWCYCIQVGNELKDWLQASDYHSSTWQTNREQYDRQQDALLAWQQPTTLSGSPTETARPVETAHRKENRPKRRRVNPLRIVSDESSADDADNLLPPPTLSPNSRYTPCQVAAASFSCSRDGGAISSTSQPSVADALLSSPPSLSPMYTSYPSRGHSSGYTEALVRPELHAQPLASRALRPMVAPFFPPRKIGRSEKK